MIDGTARNGGAMGYLDYCDRRFTRRKPRQTFWKFAINSVAHFRDDSMISIGRFAVLDDDDTACAWSVA